MICLRIFLQIHKSWIRRLPLPPKRFQVYQ
jgi:hypothetical protein